MTPSKKEMTRRVHYGDTRALNSKNDQTWQDWVDPYIVESKRLLTVRRNNVRFKHLHDRGVDIVERKGGIRMRLAEYDLDMHWRTALSHYAEQHEAHCVDFATELLEQAGAGTLTEQAGPTKSELIDFLATGLNERDFRDLF